MASIGGKAVKGVIKDVVAEAAETGAKASVKAQKKLYQRAWNKAGAKILEGNDNIIDRAVNKNFGEAINSLKAKEARLGQAAKDGAKAGAKAGAETSAKGADAVEDIVEEKVKSSRGKNALIGSAIGGISGAGIGGIAGMATGADEDNQNGMIVTGALAGMAGGAMVGGLFGNNISKVAGGIAKGASNEAVEGGAKGLFKSVQNFADKIDDIGTNVYKKTTKQSRLELAKQIKKNSNLTSKQALDMANKAASSSAEKLKKGITVALDDGSIGKLAGMEADDIELFTKSIRTGNTLGGAAQGAIMGSVGGAVIGGIGGGIDEDDTFIGGALKGGLIGGTLGGIGGGVSGHFNNNAKLFANTTANVNSLLGKK
jgi:hypothetical protein